MIPDPAIYSVIALPFDLLVMGDCVGATSPTTMGEMETVVLMPRLRSQEPIGGRFYLDPPETPGLRDDVDWAQFFDTVAPWGVPVSWSRTEFGPEAKAIISHLLVRVVAEPPGGEDEIQEVGLSLQESSQAWAELVGDWLEVITGRWLRRPHRHGSGASVIGRDLSWHFDGKRGVVLKHAQLEIEVVGDTSGAVDLATWHTATRLAGERRALPTEYALLRDARASLQLGDMRRALLDAATATEIALTTLLDRQLSATDPAVAAIVRHNVKQLGPLSRTLQESFQLHLPADIPGRLASLRNKAIHSGYSPSDSETRTAISIAQSVVLLATPLSDAIA